VAASFTGAHPDSEIEDGHDGVFWGAHASGVWFLASRRKHRATNIYSPEIFEIVDDQSSGSILLQRVRQRLSKPVLRCKFLMSSPLQDKSR
jgi:hypothetical protein